VKVPAPRATLRDTALVAALAALYVAAARLGLALDAVAGFATLVWPPTGISLAALLLFGYRMWPGIFIGATVANVLTGAPLAVALGIGVGNTAEALLGTYALRRIPNFYPALDRLRDVLGLIVFAGLVSTMVSATIGVASLYLGDIVSTAQLRETWRAWWIGDLMGALLVAPIILVWTSRPRARFPLRWIEGAALGAAVVLVGTLTFFSDAPSVSTAVDPFRQTYMLFPVLIWAALRFGQRGATTAAFVVSAIAIWGTALGHGPFVHPVLHERLLALQTFMAIVAATFLVMGAIIAERRRAEEEARVAQRAADAANLVKSEFLAVMSHELRTPLNAIAGYTDLIATETMGPVTEKQRDSLTRIQKNQQHLLSLINDVLGFARVEAGQVLVDLEKVRVKDALDAVEPLIQPELQQKKFLFRRLPVDGALLALADPKKLQQILLNLLSNAAKYTSEGGTIALGAERSGANVRIWVQDTGIGIAEEQLEKVFEPFFQVDRGTKRRYSGVGLGLTIARDLARRMHGDIRLESKLGDGTTASLVLPAA
jgi:signal transduction histidine kinase